MITKKEIEQCDQKRMNELMTPYLDNEMKSLIILIDDLAKGYQLAPNILDGFYDQALFILMECAVKYNDKKNDNFRGWLKSCLSKKLNTFVRDETLRDRRRINAISMSLDSSVDKEDVDGPTLAEVIKGSNGSLIDEVYAKDHPIEHLDKSRWGDYLKRLTPRQREILEYFYNGYSSKEIESLLHITRSELNKDLQVIRLHKNTKHLNKIRRSEMN